MKEAALAKSTGAVVSIIMRPPSIEDSARAPRSSMTSERFSSADTAFSRPSGPASEGRPAAIARKSFSARGASTDIRIFLETVWLSANFRSPPFSSFTSAYPRSRCGDTGSENSSSNSVRPLCWSKSVCFAPTKARPGVLNVKLRAPESSAPPAEASESRAVAVYRVAGASLPPEGVKTNVETSRHTPVPAISGEKENGDSEGASFFPTASSATAASVNRATISAAFSISPCGENERTENPPFPPSTGAANSASAAKTAHTARTPPESNLLCSIVCTSVKEYFSRCFHRHKHTTKL